MCNYDLLFLFCQWIGFDKLVSLMQGGQDFQGFFLYNIEKIDDNYYCILLVLVGFKQSELDIEVEGLCLIVCGKLILVEKQVEYLY